MKTISLLFSLVLLVSAATEASASRIVVLTTTGWDFVKQLGKSSEVVGRAENIVAPEIASAPSVGRSDSVNTELLLSLKPDMVIGSPQYHAPLQAQLEATGAKLLFIRIKRWDDVPAELSRIGEILGAPAEGKAAAAQVTAAMKEAASVKPGGPKVAILVSADPLIAATAASYSADLVRLAGGDATLFADQAGSKFPGFAQLSEEQLVQINPDVILLSRWHGTEELEVAFAKKAYWPTLKAVKGGTVHAVEASQLYTVPGPRGIETVKTLRPWFEAVAK